MTSETAVKATVKRRFKASAERVFDAFLDPAKAGRFMFATRDGAMVKAEIDPRVGGAFNFTDRRNGDDIEHRGEYLVIERPRRLVFTLAVDKYSKDVDRVTIEITPLDSGCELKLTHEMKPEYAEYTGRTEQGWTSILEGLARTLGEDYDDRLIL
jgi:uncharacterized protein YndB with AHSA1/START domain